MALGILPPEHAGPHLSPSSELMNPSPQDTSNLVLCPREYHSPVPTRRGLSTGSLSPDVSLTTPCPVSFTLLDPTPASGLRLCLNNDPPQQGAPLETLRTLGCCHCLCPGTICASPLSTGADPWLAQSLQGRLVCHPSAPDRPCGALSTRHSVCTLGGPCLFRLNPAGSGASFPVPTLWRQTRRLWSGRAWPVQS